MPFKRSILFGIAVLFVLTACGGSDGADNPDDSATEGNNIFELIASAGIGGTVRPTSITARLGGTRVFSIIPDEGYELESVTGCDGILEDLIFTTSELIAECSISVSFNLGESTADTTSPIISDFNINSTTNSANITFSSDELGTAYYVIQQGGDVPTTVQIIDGVGNGGTLVTSGSLLMSMGPNSFNSDTLSAQTTYSLHLVGEDADANRTTISSRDFMTTVPVPESPDTLTLDCTEWAYILNGEYSVQNNIWGRGSIVDWSQCVGIGVGPNGSVSARFTWDWPNLGNNVKAYPEVIFGLKPGGSSTTPALPKQVNTIQQLNVQYDIESSHTGIGNTAFDIWLTNTDTPDAFTSPPITHEIMIWLERYGNKIRGGAFYETALIGGESYNVYIGNFGWAYIMFERTNSGLGSATLNIKDFLDYALNNSFITGQEYVATVELGNEVVTGSGETKIHQFSVSVIPQ